MAVRAVEIRKALRKIEESTGQKVLWTVDTQPDIAEFFGMSIDTIKNWRKQGMPGTQGSWRLDRIVQWLRSDGPGSSRLADDVDTDDKARKLRAEADKAEMIAETMAGDLVPADMVRETFKRTADVLRLLGDDLGRATAPMSGKDVQKRINEALMSIEWGQ